MRHALKGRHGAECGGGGGGLACRLWCTVLVCSWRRLLANRHSLPFPWTLSLHWLTTVYPSSPSLAYPALSTSLSFPLAFPTGGGGRGQGGGGGGTSGRADTSIPKIPSPSPKSSKRLHLSGPPQIGTAEFRSSKSCRNSTFSYSDKGVALARGNVRTGCTFGVRCEPSTPVSFRVMTSL